MGRNHEIIDNGLSSIRSRIDIDHGVTYTQGVDGFGKTYIFHPDSNKQIVGFCLPEWDSLLELANEVMITLEDYARYIGFDIAFTTTGWKLIEVNPFPQLQPQQITTKQGSRPEMLHLADICK